MGILSWLFGKHRKAEAQSRHVSAPVSGPVFRHKVPRAINIDGDCETKVFTYLGVPFKGLRKSQEIYVDIIDRDVEIRATQGGSGQPPKKL